LNPRKSTFLNKLSYFNFFNCNIWIGNLFNTYV
jgi:hypothetical protein